MHFTFGTNIPQIVLQLRHVGFEGFHEQLFKVDVYHHYIDVMMLFDYSDKYCFYQN